MTCHDTKDNVPRAIAVIVAVDRGSISCYDENYV